jgi:hypothetical protein
MFKQSAWPFYGSPEWDYKYILFWSAKRSKVEEIKARINDFSLFFHMVIK